MDQKACGGLQAPDRPLDLVLFATFWLESNYPRKLRDLTLVAVPKFGVFTFCHDAAPGYDLGQ